MAQESSARIIDPNGMLGARTVEPESLANPSDGTGSGTDGNSSGDHFARDSDGNVIRNADGSPRKKRGRKPGSARNQPKASKATNDIKGIESLLFSIHLGVASFTKIDELALDKEEANMLAKALSDVQNFYNFETSAEMMLWANVMGTCGAIYGPRIVSIFNKRKEKKSEKDNVVEQPLINEGFTVPHHAPAE